MRHLFQRSSTAGAAIGRTPTALRMSALSVATGQSVAGAADFERRTAARGMDTSLLWSAHTPEGTIAAAVLAVPAPGRTASVLFAPGSGPDGWEWCSRVLRAAAEDLDQAGPLALLQSLPKPGEQERIHALNAGGFQRLALLDYMERDNTLPRGGAPAWPDGYQLTPWQPSDRAMLIQLLQNTFEGTLDCPGLSNMRTGDDILNGHLQAGDGNTSLWRILRQAGTPVGTLLLSPCRATHSVDLIYLGLVPHARARGLGTTMLLHALREATAVKSRCVQVAVDTANAPAVAIYRRAGFISRQQREAWVRPLSSGATCPQRVDS